MPFVLDAFVALSWYFEDETDPYPDQVLARMQSETAVVPAVWPLEVANGLAIAERRGRLSGTKVLEAVALHGQLDVVIRDLSHRDVFESVLPLARAHRLIAYDASYVHLAVQEGAAIATFDERMRGAAARLGIRLFGT